MIFKELFERHELVFYSQFLLLPATVKYDVFSWDGQYLRSKVYLLL